MLEVVSDRKRERKGARAREREIERGGDRREQ